MKMHWSTAALLLMLVAGDVTAQARRELVGRIFHRGANDEEIPERGVPVTLEPSGAATRSNDQGIFRLPLQNFLRPDDVVTLAIDKEGWRIRYPLDGELRVPAEPGRQVVEIELLPAGSKLFWSNDRVEKFIEDAIRQSAAKTPDTSETREDKVLDFSRAIRDWAERYGLSAEVAKQEIDTWIAEVKTAAETDERKLGLAAFAEQHFEKAARHFGLAAAASVAELAEIERAEKALDTKKSEARQAIIFNYRSQGIAEGNARRFEAAIAAHRKVLEVVTREEMPQEWAKTHLLIGSVFFGQSLFMVGGESESSLSAALCSIRSALEVLSREKDPRDWAEALRHRGSVLEMLAIRNPAEEEKNYDEALSDYRSILEVFQEDNSEVWASLQVDIGEILLKRAQRATDPTVANELLSQSVSAHRSALEVYTRDRYPRQWAITQVKLRRVLSALSSQSDAGTERKSLEEVISALRSELELTAREQNPQSWASTQIHLGQAFRNLARQESGDEGRRLLQEAAERHRLALEVYTREDLPLIWAATQSHLGRVLLEQGIRISGEAGMSLLGEANAALCLSLEVLDRKEYPVFWARTQHSLADVFLEQGRRAAGEEKCRFLGEAVSSFRSALEVYTREVFPKEWATIQASLETAQQELDRPVGESVPPRYSRRGWGPDRGKAKTVFLASPG